MSSKNYDLVVLGGSESGYETAISAAKNGLNVAIVDSNLLGGVQKMIVDMPLKDLIMTLPGQETVEMASDMGIELSAQLIDSESFDEHLKKRAQKYSNDIVAKLKDNDIDIYLGKGHVHPNHSITVFRDDLKPRTFNFKKLVYAEEPKFKLPKNFSEELDNYYTTDNFGLLSEVPEELIIFGKGLAVLKAAQVWSQLGSKVNLVVDAPRVIDKLPETIEQRYLSELKKNGVKVFLNTALEEIYRVSSGYFHAMLRSGDTYTSIIGDELMILTEQEADTSGLERINIVTEDGWITTDETLTSSDKDILTWTASPLSKKYPNATKEAAQYLGDRVAGKTEDIFRPKESITSFDLIPPYFELGEPERKGKTIKKGIYEAADKTRVELNIDTKYGELVGARISGINGQECASLLAMIMALEGSVEEYGDLLLVESPAKRYIQQAIDDAYRRNT